MRGYVSGELIRNDKYKEKSNFRDSIYESNYYKHEWENLKKRHECNDILAT